MNACIDLTLVKRGVRLMGMDLTQLSDASLSTYLSEILALPQVKHIVKNPTHFMGENVTLELGNLLNEYKRRVKH